MIRMDHLRNKIAVIMSVDPILQLSGKQHLYAVKLPVMGATLCTRILVPVPPPVLSIQRIGVVLLVHEVPSDDCHPPSLVPFSASLCIHCTLRVGSLLGRGRKHDPLG